MAYILDEKQIEKIIREGKFDHDKYATQYCILGWTFLDILSSKKNDLMCKNPEELEILDQEELNKALEDLDNYSTETDASDVYDFLTEGLNLNKDINEIIKIKGE